MNLLAPLVFLVPGILAANKFESVHEWKAIDYVWPSDSVKEEALQNKDYVPTRVVPTDIDKSKDGRVFITLYRVNGVPASLGTVSSEKGPNGPLIAPYPNWSWHEKRDCEKIISVHRIVIDECNRLWVLDNGRIGNTAVCPSQLYVFDLSTDQLIRKVPIPKYVSDNSTGKGLLVNVVVQTEGPCCENTTVFMADAEGFGLIIWNGRSFTRLEAPVFATNSSALRFTMGGVTFTTSAGGITGMSLAPKILANEPHVLIFRPLASFGIFYATISSLIRATDGKKVRFYGSSDVLTSQSYVQAISSEGTLFYSLPSTSSIGCWNRYRPLQKENTSIAATDEQRLQFLSGMKVLPISITKDSEELWVAAKQHPKAASKQNPDEINFRILKITMEQLLQDTECSIPNKVKNHLKILSDKPIPVSYCAFQTDFDNTEVSYDNFD